MDTVQDTAQDVGFSHLPNEILIKLCQQMDDQTLTKMSLSYSRVYQVCSDIIKDRKIHSRYQQRIELEKLLNRIQPVTYKYDDRDFVNISIIEVDFGRTYCKIKITQTIILNSTETIVSWNDIFQEQVISRGDTSYLIRILYKRIPVYELEDIISSLHNKGYTLI